MPKLEKQIQAIRASLRSLDSALRQIVPVLSEATRASVATVTAAAKPPKRKLRLSRARRRALKLQGQYLGNMRQLKPGQKAKVKAMKAEKGMRAAIATARKMARN